jgi:uncharacterized coiled-coil protein SlyX
MWILKWMPDWIFHLMLIAGLLGLAASFVLKFVPFVAQYRVPIQWAAGILIVIGIYMEGAISNEAAWQARVKELEIKVARAEAKSQAANADLVSKLGQREKQIAQQQQQLKDRIRDNAQVIDAQCRVPAEAIAIINDAAKKTGDKR